MNIKTISFDEKSNAVTISGPFDADKVCNKLCSEAGRVIKEMDVKGKEKAKDGGGDKPKAASKGGETKDAGKADKEGAKADKKEDKAEKKEGKADKDGGKAEKKEDKAKEGNKDGKAEPKKVKFAEDAAPAGDAKPAAKAMTKADLAPLLEKMMAAKAGPEPPRGEPIAPAMVPGAAQGVAVPSIWPAPAGSVSGYGYNPGYDAQSYYGGGAGAYGCGCGGYNGYCRCGKPAAPGGYYGVPVYDSQGWYYGGGGRQPYYQQQQPGYEDPNAGCSVM